MNTSYGINRAPGIFPVGGGLRTDQGTLLPAGGNTVAYVDNSTGSLQTLPSWLRSRRVPTLNEGLSRVTAGQGDVVLVGPNHAEELATADALSSLKAGTVIMGLGHGELRPTLTWSAAGSTVLLDVDNVQIYNMRLQLCPLSGTVTVANPITVSGAGVALVGNRINFGTDANAKITTGILTTAAANDFTFQSNDCFGATAAPCNEFMRIVGGARPRIVGNHVSGATSSPSIAIVRGLTTLHTDGLVTDNVIKNNRAGSTAAFALVASSTGYMNNNHFAINDNSTTTVAAGNYTLGANNTLANLVGERGLVIGTVSA